MSLPLLESNSALENFLQELLEDYWDLAIEFKAFSRGRKIKTLARLLRVVLCYGGIDQVLREVAGDFTLWEERISDTAIHQRLKACLPWVKVLLERMIGAAVGPLRSGRLCFVVVDGSTVQGPGAKQTWYRLHIAVDLLKLHLIHVKVTDNHEGEQLAHYPLQGGDVVLVDRGYNQPAKLIEQIDKGVSVVLRYNPHGGMNVYDPDGEKIDLYDQLHGTPEMSLCIPVRIYAEGQSIDGYIHACRLPAEQAEQARRRCRATPRRVWQLLRQELAVTISGVCHWDLRRWQACLEVIQERPCQRQLQTLPPRVNHLIAYCQANRFSNR